MFVKVIDGVTVKAPTRYTTDDGYVINNFIRYLESMHELELLDKMYGFEYIEDIVDNTNNKIEKLEKENMFLTASNFDLDFRVFEIEEIILSATPTTLNFKNINNELGGGNMTQYLMAKKLILAGYYDRDDMEYKLGRYASAGRITQAQYDELIALMAADDIMK